MVFIANGMKMVKKLIRVRFCRPDAALTSELERIEKIIETKDPTKKENLPHKDFRCYMGWREPPLGTGEASVVVVPLDDEELTDQQLTKLMEALKVSHFSEETIDFGIQELDR